MRRQQEEHRHINFVEHVKQGCFCSLLGFWILSSIRLSNARVWLRSLSLSVRVGDAVSTRGHVRFSLFSPSIIATATSINNQPESLP